MKKDSYEKVFEFYILLHIALTRRYAKGFSSVCQAHLAIRDEVSLKDLTVEMIREARSERAIPERDGKVLIQFSEAVFKDFAPYLRDPKARKITAMFRELSYTECDDLYIQVENVRLLDADENGPAVVTITTDCYNAFRDVLDRLHEKMESHLHIHRSFGEKIEPRTTTFKCVSCGVPLDYNGCCDKCVDKTTRDLAN